MVTVWKQVLIRVAQEELKAWDEYCEKNYLKRVELIRNSVRTTIANPDLVKNMVVKTNCGTEDKLLVDALKKLEQKVGNVEKILNSKPFETNHTEDNIAKIKIRECVQDILGDTNVTSPTTVDRLRERMKNQEPSLAPYLVSSSNRAFSLLDEVLYELQVKGEIKREYGGIIKFGKG